jgi:hypothetical protein
MGQRERPTGTLGTSWLQTTGSWSVFKQVGGAHGLHEEAADHLGRDLEEPDPLAAAVATGLGAVERAGRALERSEELAKAPDPT